MIIKAQDIKPGYKLRTKVGGMIVTAKKVTVMEEKKSLFTPSGKDPLRMPACVLVIFDVKGVEHPYTFNIDEEVDRAFINE